jgi:hypothetical protein
MNLVELNSMIAKYYNQVNQCKAKVDGYKHRLATEELRPSTERDIKVLEDYWAREYKVANDNYWIAVEKKARLIEQGVIEQEQYN